MKSKSLQARKEIIKQQKLNRHKKEDKNLLAKSVLTGSKKKNKYPN